jgi:hypothetical protein
MARASKLRAPLTLARTHHCDEFDCSSEPLNDCLKRLARTNQQATAARTYVATRGNRIVVACTLAYGSVDGE